MDIIYYFTGTGNSQMLAEQLAQILPEAQTIQITYQIPTHPPKAEHIIFVFPVYFSGIPNIMRSFITNLPISAGTKCYAISAPNISSGAAFYIVHNLLAQKGLKLDAGYQINMPENFIAKFSPQSPEKQAQRFQNAAVRLKQIAAYITRSTTNPAPRKKPLSLMYHNRNRARFHEKAQTYTVTSSCTGCHTCEQICPTQNIRVTDNRPQFLSQCEYCMACIQYCPVHAIQCSPRSAKRPHYHNPHVTRP